MLNRRIFILTPGCREVRVGGREEGERWIEGMKRKEVGEGRVEIGNVNKTFDNRQYNLN